MGWDAFSSVKRGIYNGVYQIENEELRNAFILRSEHIKAEAGSVDGSFEHGTLDVSSCAYMLQEATGESCWTEDDWSSEKVKQLNEQANWSFTYDKSDYWAYLSAKEFLALCAEHNLSIRFSF